jgi:hypothetical protein
MASSKAAIFNMALTLIGQEPISDPDSADDQRAIAMRQVYDICRLALLEEHPWNFAIERATLAPDVTAPEFEFDYQYTLPSNMVRTLKLYDSGTYFREEGSKLLTDSDSVYLVYVKNVTDVVLFPAMFTKVLAYDMAIAAEYKVTNQQNLQSSLLGQRQQALIKAKMVDAQRDNQRKNIKSKTKESRGTPYGDLD